MVDMSKMKEEALRRKREHEEKELRRQMASSKPRSASRRSSGSRRVGRSNPSAQRALAQQQRSRPKKRKRSISRWVLDILLVLGALLVLVMFLSPFR